MNLSFLEYYKIILEKVSFDRKLFDKEYKKAVQLLDHRERTELDQWLAACGLRPDNGQLCKVLAKQLKHQKESLRV